MIAYLVQKDCAKILDEKFGGDKYSKEWGDEKFERILEREFKGKRLNKIGKLIMEMWEEKLRSEDVVAFSKRVVNAYAEVI